MALADYSASDGSISYGPDGATFAFTLEPVSDEMVAALGDVAEKRERICLYGCGEPLLLRLGALERKEPRKVRLVGVVSSTSDGTIWDSQSQAG